MRKKPLLTVVAPIYFGETSINEFYNRTKKVLINLESKIDHEIIFVDDGSKDKSLDILKELCQKDEKVGVISFSRNFGHQIAITAGIDHANGEAIIIIDGDLQDPPEIIPEMLKKWEEGYKVVYGVRKKRKGENFIKLSTAKLFYRIIRHLSDVDLPVDAGDFRLIDKKVADILRSMREENRYIRGIVSWIGFPQSGLLYERDRRYAGKTTYTFKKMIKLAIDGLVGFSDKPLKITAYLGFFITFISFLLVLKIVIDKIINPQLSISGWASLMVTLIFLGGIQMISIGIIGLYLGRQYSEVKRRPIYVVSETYGIKNNVNDSEYSREAVGPNSPEA